MQIEEVKKILTTKETDGCYLVHFEAKEGKGGCILAAKYFPDPGETPFRSEQDAWNWAAAFANTLGPAKVVNVYVVDASNWRPVDDYRKRLCNPHPIGRRRF
jgi:hypothetical protein